MALRKFNFAMDCDSEEEFAAAQEALRQISGMGLLSAKKMIAYYPLVQSKQREVSRLFHLITNGGIKSLLSIEGIQLVKSFTSKKQ